MVDQRDGQSASGQVPVGQERPTLEEVAERAGVGRSTVSRVINGSPRVSEFAKEAVRRAVEELGYVPNRAARSLVSGRTDTVALVVSESEERVFAEPFFAGIIRGITSGLADTGLQLLLSMAQSPTEREQLRRYLSGQHVDGVLLLSLHGDDPLPRQLEATRVPAVRGGRPTRGGHAGYVVDIDNRGGAREAMAHLAARGRRRIATVAGPQDMVAGAHRFAGYRDGLARAGSRFDDGLVEVGDFSQAGGAAAMTELLARRPDLDAVFAASDLMALGALRVLGEAGRRVPDDVAVVGFDDLDLAQHSDPPLSTVHQPVEEYGRQMARLLLGRIRGEPVEQEVILGTRLVARASS